MRPKFLTDLYMINTGLFNILTNKRMVLISLTIAIIVIIYVHSHAQNDTHQYTPTQCSSSPTWNRVLLLYHAHRHHAIYDSRMATGCLWLSVCPARTIRRNIPKAMHACVIRVKRSIGNTVAFLRTVHVCQLPRGMLGCSQWNALVFRLLRCSLMQWVSFYLYFKAL